jgi:hypothetical protein
MRLLLIILATTLAVYFPVVDLGFVSDDHGLITHPVTGITQQTLGSVFQSDLWHFQESQSGYYRPLMMVSLMVDHAAFGDWAGGYHLHSLAWHLLCVFLIGRLLGQLFDPTRGAIAAALYAVHPVVSETVCFVSARNDSMALALGLGAILLTAPRKANGARCFGAAVLAAAACLAKENGVVVLALLPLIDWARFNGPRAWSRHVALATGAMAALCLREVVGPGLGHTPPMNAATLLADQKLTVFSELLSKLAWPMPLTDSSHLAYLSPINIPALCAAGFLVIFLSIAGGRWGRAGVAFAAFAAIPGLMAIASRFLIGERYLALPVLGIIFAFTAMLPRSKKLPWGLILLLPWCWICHQRVADWSTDLSLARSAHTASPSPYTAAWLGHELALDGQAEAALPYYDEATQGTPPTCDFAGEWIHAAVEVNGPEAGLAAAQAIWNRRCAATTGVRGAWAQAKLEAGDIDGAVDLLTPMPARCTTHLALPMVALFLQAEQTMEAKQCASEAGMPFDALQSAAERLLSLADTP